MNFWPLIGTRMKTKGKDTNANKVIHNDGYYVVEINMTEYEAKDFEEQDCSPNIRILNDTQHIDISYLDFVMIATKIFKHFAKVVIKRHFNPKEVG